MENIVYANVYKEVLIVINNLIKEDYEKIPKEYINYLEENANKNYDFKYNISKSFEEQDLLDETKYILWGLFEKFGATDTQKEKIDSLKKNYYNKLEQEKEEKYNPNDLFKRQNTIINNANNKNISLPVEIKKDNFFIRFINYIKELFRK